MKVASSILLNIERARETGELDYLVTIRLCCEALRALLPCYGGLSRRGKNERKERDLCLCLSFLSFLPRRERSLLTGKRATILTISQKLNTTWSLLALKVNE